MVSGPKGIIYVGDAIDVVEQLSYVRAPGAGAGQGVVGVQLKPAGKAMAHGQGDAVITRAVIGAKYGKIGRIHRQGDASYIFIAAILMDSLLMFVIDVQPPRRGQGMFKACR